MVVEMDWRDRALIYFGFRPERSDLVLRVAFVNLIANLVEWASPPSEGSERRLLGLGERLGRVEAGARLRPLHREGAELDATARLDEAGVYELLNAKGEVDGRVSVNLLSVDESSINVSTQRPDFVQTALPDPTHDSHFPWRWLLGFVLLLLALEWLIHPIAQLVRRRLQSIPSERIGGAGGGVAATPPRPRR